MQTKEQFMEKFEEVLETTIAKIRDDAERLFISSAEGPETYEDNYILPKLILIACLQDANELWNQFGKKGRKVIKNLRCF